MFNRLIAHIITWIGCEPDPEEDRGLLGRIVEAVLWEEQLGAK